MRHISSRFKVFAYLFLSSLGSCDSKAQVYTDLNDLGYRGKIKSINTKTYYGIAHVQNKWEITDTTSSLSMFKFFNEDGNFTKRIVIAKGNREQFNYDYSNHEKTGWTKIDNDGDVIAKGKFTYEGKKRFTESEYTNSGTKKFESIYTLDDMQRTKTLEDIGYEYHSHPGGMETKLTYHAFTVFQDKDGGLYKATTQDKLRNTTVEYEFEIIERDKFDNPIVILVKQNGRSKEIRKSTIDYLVE